MHVKIVKKKKSVKETFMYLVIMQVCDGHMVCLKLSGHFARGKKFPFGRGKSHVIATLQSRIKKMERGFMSILFKILNRTTLNRHSLADKVG